MPSSRDVQGKIEDMGYFSPRAAEVKARHWTSSTSTRVIS